MKLEKNRKNNSQSLYPVVTVIIPFCGNKSDLFKCLTGLQNQNCTFAYEVIVVESGNDSDVKQFMNPFPNFSLIYSHTLLYPGKARNLAVKNSRTEFLAFIDADCVPSSNWLSEIYSSLKDGNEIVIGPITNLYPFHPIASIDNILQFVDFQKFREIKPVSHFPACNLGITKELFFKAGGFPEELLTGEDVLFSQSAIRNCKGKILFNKGLVVKHSGRRNIAGLFRHNEDLGFYRGFLNLKISFKNINFRKSFLFPIMFGVKRMGYIIIRTLQWNPTGIFRIVLFFPFFILGLSAWVKGFREGNKKYLEEKNSHTLKMEASLK